MLSYYNTYQQDRAMLDSLYGETSTTERASQSHDVKFGLAFATEAFKARVLSRKELVSNYCSFLTFGFLVDYCCCFARCCNRSRHIRRSARRYRKFKLALERLALEQDIQYIL